MTSQLRKSSAKRDRPMNAEVQAVLATLKGLGSKRIREEMGPRYGVTGASAESAFGVRMSAMQKLAKGVKRKDAAWNHELASALWDWKGDGQYEARMVAVFVDEPSHVTAAQMDRWCKDFDNWGICDTACFKLFDQVSPDLAFRKVKQWAERKGEFQKRAAFALLGCLALHNKDADDELFLRCMPLVERAAVDQRNFVKKGVSWGLRGVGRRSSALSAAAVAVAKRLAGSQDATARWVGKDALRELTRSR